MKTLQLAVRSPPTESMLERTNPDFIVGNGPLSRVAGRKLLIAQEIYCATLLMILLIVMVSCTSDFKLDNTTSALIAGSRIEATVTTSVTPVAPGSLKSAPSAPVLQSESDASSVKEP